MAVVVLGGDRLELMSTIKTYQHGDREVRGRVMARDDEWTTLMLYRGDKADKPLTVRTRSLKEKESGLAN